MKNIAESERRSLLPSPFGLFLGLAGALVGLLWLGAGLTGKSCSPSLAYASPLEIRHPVGPGEDLHLLAAYYYGDARQWKRIWETNRHQIKNPNRISPQQVLRIEVPEGWQPSMPFSTWMERLREAAAPPETTSPKEAPPPPEKPAAEEPKK